MITQELVRHLFDYKDGQLIWNVKKNGIRKNKIAGHLNKSGYVSIQIEGKLYRMHRVIFLWHHGYMPAEIDHINRIKNDNRIENLRSCTRSENCNNKGVRSDSTSGIPGITWEQAHGKWRVRILVNGKRKSLGLFKNIEEAKARLVDGVKA